MKCLPPRAAGTRYHRACCLQHTPRRQCISRGDSARTTRQCKRRHAGQKEVNVTKIAAPAGRRAKPKLGQHFLVDTAAPMRIVEALGDISQSTVLEIGPGRGALTSLLAKRARRLIAIEIDRVLAAQLRMNFSQEPNVEIIEGDVLAIDFHTLFGPKPGSTRPGMNHQPETVRVVGNLPYFITSDILLRLFEFRQYFETIVLMVQREVAERLGGRAGAKRIRSAFRHGPALCPGGENVHASARRLLAAAQSRVDGGAAADRAEDR